MNMMTVPHTNGSAKGMQALWLRSTVEEFFSSVNWDDRPIEVVESKALLENALASTTHSDVAEGAHLSLSLAMSVNAFFDAFPWEGQPMIAAPIPVHNTALKEPEDDVNDITLDDFSGLF